MGPDTITAHVAELGARRTEIVRTFFEQDAAGGVVAAVAVARAAIVDADLVNGDVLRVRHQHGEAGDFPQPYALDPEGVNTFGENSICSRESREWHVGRRQASAGFKGIAVAVDGEIVKLDAGAVDYDDRAALEIRCSVQHGAGAYDFGIRADVNFGVDFDGAWRKPDNAAIRRPVCNKKDGSGQQRSGRGQPNQL